LWWLTAIGAVAVVAVLAWQQSAGPADEHSATRQVLAPIAGWFNSRPTTTVVEAAERAASTVGDVKPFNPLDTMAMPVFRAGDNKRLVIDGQTRNDVERMVALFSDDHGLEKIEALSIDLPPEARHDLRDLYQRYQQYSQALTAAISPQQATLEDAYKQFDTMRELRSRYFGEEQARAMFGEEEATTRQLLDLMSKQTDPKASLEQRAQQAQALWQKDHPEGASAPGN
jgi:hypothetical protein